MDTIASGHAAALWVGLHVLLPLTLSLLVVRLRQKHKVALGDEGIPELARAIRAFGNASEYVPVGLAAIIVLALVGAPAAGDPRGGPGAVRRPADPRRGPVQQRRRPRSRAPWA